MNRARGRRHIESVTHGGLQGVMAWDDELDHLTTSVGDLLGEEVLSAAMSASYDALRIELRRLLQPQ